jgi:hypothetical protein
MVLQQKLYFNNMLPEWLFSLKSHKQPIMFFEPLVSMHYISICQGKKHEQLHIRNF